MTIEQFKNNLDCDTDFTIMVDVQLPAKADESIAFDVAMDTYVRELKQNISDTEFKKFEKHLAKKVIEGPQVESASIPPDEENTWRLIEHNFRLLLDDNDHAPLSYTQELFGSLIKLHINENLKKTVVEYFSLMNTLPPTAQIFEINASFIHDMFGEFELQYLNLVPGKFYYLKECIYEKSSKRSDLNANEIGSFEFRFCLWNMVY